MQNSHNYHYAGSGNGTGKVEEFIAPVSGKYKLECWGASGCTIYPTATYLKAGLGGYSRGSINASTNKVLYVCVGESGVYGSFSYNNNERGALHLGSPGGGATHVSQNVGGELKTFSTHKDDVLLVAGGGGSCDIVSGKEASGGYGGGEEGGPGSSTDGSYCGTGGTASTGGTTRYQYQGVDGSFGLGGVGWASNGDYAAQGGSGWYGGGGGCSSTVGTSGGGSGYVNKSLLSDAKTIAGNESFPSPSVDGKNNETGHAGDGACVITQTSF